MSLYSIRKLTPNIGKAALLAERARALAGIYARNGARARVARVIAGDEAGQIYVGLTFDDAKSMAQIWERTQADPSLARLMEERELNPAGSASGPEVYRTVYGQVEPGYPVILQREYTISRDKLSSALALLPELDALVKDQDIRILAAVPVFSSDMSRLIAGYYYRSPARLGEAIDGVGTSAEFQSIVTRAAAFGSLTRSRVLVTCERLRGVKVRPEFYRNMPFSVASTPAPPCRMTKDPFPCSAKTNVWHQGSATCELPSSAHAPLGASLATAGQDVIFPTPPFVDAARKLTAKSRCTRRWSASALRGWYLRWSFDPARDDERRRPAWVFP